jgi:hypothetical protein
MLNAAGMPLDLDKQQLLQTALAANAQLQQVRGGLMSTAADLSRALLSQP